MTIRITGYTGSLNIAQFTFVLNGIIIDYDVPTAVPDAKTFELEIWCGDERLSFTIAKLPHKQSFVFNNGASGIIYLIQFVQS